MSNVLGCKQHPKRQTVEKITGTQETCDGTNAESRARFQKGTYVASLGNLLRGVAAVSLHRVEDPAKLITCIAFMECPQALINLAPGCDFPVCVVHQRNFRIVPMVSRQLIDVGTPLAILIIVESGMVGLQIRTCVQRVV